MSNPANLGALLYADEASWGEVSTTFDQRLPIIAQIDTSGLTQEKIALGHVHQYANDGIHDARGVYGGSFTVSLYLPGHGSTCAGAVTASEVGTFLGRCLGANSVANDGGTATGGTAAAPTTSGLSVFGDGSLCRIGSANDGRGNGQFAAVNNLAAGTLTLLTAIDAAPNAGDVVYAPEMVYPLEAPSTVGAVTSLRFQIQTANQKYNCFGCWASAITVTGLNPGELPKVDVTISVSRWAAESSSTFPTATASDYFVPAPTGGGSLFRQVNGTTTRNKDSIHQFNLQLDLQTVPILGPGASEPRQVVIGCTRTGCQATFDYVVAADAAGTDTLGDIWNTSESTLNYYHLLYTLSAEDKTAVGFYFPKATITGMRPTQFDMDGLNRKRVFWRALTAGDTTSALTNASWIMGLA